MKRYIKRNLSEGMTFIVYNDTGEVLYRITSLDDPRRRCLWLTDTEGQPLAEINHKQLMLHYFTVRCQKSFYVLVPTVKECFAFLIYGSTYRFAGDLTTGRFSLFDVDKSPVMTQQKCWTAYGDGYELELYVPEQELFCLCTAVCAALYLTTATGSTVPGV